VMYAIGISLCVLPLIGWGLYLLFKKLSCGCDCDCRTKKRYSARVQNLAPPMPYSPPPVAEPEVSPVVII